MKKILFQQNLYAVFKFIFLIYSSISASPIPTNCGGTGNVSFAANAVLTAGALNAGVLQPVSGLGSSGQVLTCEATNAVPNWQNNNYGLTRLQTLTAASSPSLALTSTDLSATYNVFLIVLDNLTPSSPSASTGLQALFSINNGSTYPASSYLSGINYQAFNVAAPVNLSSTSNIVLSPFQVTYVSGYLFFYPRVGSLSSSGATAFMNGQVLVNYPCSYGMVLGYQNISALAVNNVKFQFSVGNILQGRIILYGFKAS